MRDAAHASNCGPTVSRKRLQRVLLAFHAARKWPMAANACEGWGPLLARERLRSSARRASDLQSTELEEEPAQGCAVLETAEAHLNLGSLKLRSVPARELHSNLALVYHSTVAALTSAAVKKLPSARG